MLSATPVVRSGGRSDTAPPRHYPSTTGNEFFTAMITLAHIVRRQPFDHVIANDDVGRAYGTLTTACEVR